MFFRIFSQTPSIPDCILKIPHLSLHGIVSHTLLLLLHDPVPVYLLLCPTHYCGLVITGSMASLQRITDPPASSGIPWIYARNFLNSKPCRGFVKWSLSILPIGQCSKFMSPTAIQSLIKKYRTWMCFVRWEINLRTFFSNSTTMRLYWYTKYSSTVKPCISIKYCVQRNPGRFSSSLKIYDSSCWFFVPLNCWFTTSIQGTQWRHCGPSCLHVPHTRHLPTTWSHWCCQPST